MATGGPRPALYSSPAPCYTVPTKPNRGDPMRCHCPHCEEETWMVHSEKDNACVCPQCLYRCYACQGTGTALTRDQVLSLRDNDALLRASAAFDIHADTMEKGQH